MRLNVDTFLHISCKYVYTMTCYDIFHTLCIEICTKNLKV